MHDSCGILQVESFAQEIGGDEDVGLEGRGRQWGTLRTGREGSQHVPAGGVPRGKSSDVPEDRRDPPVAKPLHQVAGRGLRIREDDGLGGPRGQQPVQRVGLGIGWRRTFEQLTQPVEDATVVL